MLSNQLLYSYLFIFSSFMNYQDYNFNNSLSPFYKYDYIFFSSFLIVKLNANLIQLI
ncbi:hypothetical protein pb186bvf_000359 [Paramecium bursaria]